MYRCVEFFGSCVGNGTGDFKRMGCMKIINGRVFGANGYFEDRELYIEEGRFVSQDRGGEVVDARGAYVVPGFTDVHFHGCMGMDVCDANDDDLQKIALFQAQNGVTQIIPATMTLSKDRLRTVFQKVGETTLNEGAMFMGVHMEGPFVSKEKLGAQNPAYVADPDLEFFEELQSLAKGRIKIISLAPETEGAMDFISKVADRVTVSLAHTVSDYETANRAFNNGARQVTHIYNAMPVFSHRAPGVIGAAFDHEEVRAEIICDGVHIHPTVIRATFKMFGRDRMILISDSMRATGLGDGEYDLGGQKVVVCGRCAEIPGVSIAGSVTQLFDCFRYAVGIGVPLEDAVLAATHNPAKNVGIWEEAGGLQEGQWANFLLLDEELNLKEVYIKGKRVERTL